MCYPFKIGCRSNGCCYLFTTKNQPFKQQGESDQIQLFVTLYICTMFKSKQTIPHTKVTVLSQNLSLLVLLLGRCQDVVFFTFATQKSTNKRCQNKTTCFYALWDSGTSIHAVLQSASFPSSRKGKIDSEAPISMNSELTEKSYRYKMDENNYKPTKSQRYLCL